MTKTDQHKRRALSRLLTTSSAGALSLGALSFGALALGALAAGPAAAQTPPQAAAASNDALEAVTVTAERQEENEKDVPVSVSTINGLTLDTLSQGGPDIRLLSARVPSLYIESSFGRTFPRFYIRGLGNSDFDLNASQPVSILQNDVVEENPILKGFPVFDTQQVEVLRGPQGTLFGRNTPAGVVKIDSNKPTDYDDGYAELSYGRFNSLNMDGAVGGPIVPGKLDFRASIYFAREDDWVSNTLPGAARGSLGGYADVAGRFQLKFMPTDDFTALLDLHARELDGTAMIFYANAIQPGTNSLVPGFNSQSVSQNGGNYQRLNTQGAALTLEQKLPEITITSVTGFERGYATSRGDVDGGNVTDVPFQSDTSDEIPLLNQLTEELRYSSNDWGSFSNQGGLFYFHETVHVTDFDYADSYVPPYGEGSVDGVAYQKQTTDSIGIFEAGKYKITDQWTVGGGVRWTHDEKDYSVNVALSPVGAPAQILKTNPFDNNVSWDLNTDYALSDEVSFYARVARANRGPAIQGRVLFENPPYISEASTERTLSYEAGIKTDLFDNKLRFNLDGYDWVSHELQLTATGGAFNSTAVLNVAQAEGWGFEADMVAKPIPPLTFSASASFNHTQIEDPNLAVAPCGSTPACHVLNPLNKDGLALLNGNPLPNAPEWIVNWDLRYEFPFANGTEAYIDTDWSYRSSIDLTLYRATEFTGPPLLLGGVRIGYIQPDQNWEIAGYVRNITNDIQLIGAIDFDNLTGMVNDPRTYGVQAIYHFGGPATPSPEVPAAIPAPPAAPAPVAKAPEAQRSFQVFFDFDKSNITEAAAHVIQAAADAVKAGNVVQITVTGHTDTVGSAKYNQALSERRAAAVKAGLVADGVAGSEITTLGVGKTGLLVPTADGVREPQNRRAEIVLQ